MPSDLVGTDRSLRRDGILGGSFANGAPKLGVDTPAPQELAREMLVPIAGKAFMTGQALMRTIINPGLRARLLGLNACYSTNILGNRG